jgi:glycosyl transferase family 61
MEIAGPCRRTVELPIMLPDEPSRIVGHHNESVAPINFERLTQRVMQQGPTRLHLVRDSIIADGTLLTAKYFQRIAPEKRKFLVQGSPEPIEEAVLCSTYWTQKYFGHWLREGFTLEQMAQDNGLEALVLDHKPWTHETGYRAMLSLDPKRTNLAWCDRLWVFDFFQLNNGFSDAYGRLRSRLRAELGAGGNSNGRVFLERSDRGLTRTLANNDEVREALLKLGFVVINPELMDARELATILAGARLVVSPEGSALAHAAIAMPRGAGLLTIMGAQHFNMPYKAISDALGFKFGLTFADPVDKERFSQPIERLLRVIDLMEDALDRNPPMHSPQV